MTNEEKGTPVIPMTDLTAQYGELRGEIDRAVQSVITSGRYIFGPSVERFESAMRSHLSLEAAFGCANGTDALYLAMMAYGLGPGDEVILPAFTFVAPLEAIVLQGGTPRFVDVDPGTFNIDPNQVEKALTDRTKAIIVVHLFGQCVEMEPILEVAAARGIRVIEDAAQSFGATRSGKLAGTMGDICCFSFYPTKNLSCMGDGGMVGTTDPAVVDRLRFLRNHGEVEKYRHAMVGMNSRLDELQAAVLLAKLPRVEGWNARRAEIAGIYDKAFAGLDLQTPVVQKENLHIYHQYTLQVPRREAFMSHLRKRGVSTAVHYPFPLPHQPAYASFSPGKGRFPVAEALCERVVSLPIYPQMDEGQIDRVVGAVRSYFGHR